jgi:hypothetical protein
MTAMHGLLTNASLARIPAAALPLIGGLRAYASVQVRIDGARAWVRWDEAGFEILRALLPVRGAEFFERLDRYWHICGRSLPAFDVPGDGFRPLASVLTAGRVQVVADAGVAFPKVVLALKRSNQPRDPAAMLCTAETLAAWADMAPTARIVALSAARSGELVLLIGQPLPAIEGERLYGERLLCPLGWAPDPDLPEDALLQAIGAGPDELALLRPGSIEIIPRDALRGLTRASARLGAA